MRTCLGSLLLVPTLLALVGTAVYHVSVNSELRFEERTSNTEYINSARSYRPQTRDAKDAKATAKPAVELQDDDTAEEVEP